MGIEFSVINSIAIAADDISYYEHNKRKFDHFIKNQLKITEKESIDKFEFRDTNPSPKGISKKDMFASLGAKTHKREIIYNDLVLLRVTPSIEYYTFFIRFNKLSRMWSYYPT